MAKFKPAKITTLGQQMMAQDLNNEIDLEFTRIVYGNGTYTNAEYETITTRTALKSQKQSIPINRKVRENNTSVSLIGVLSNLTLEEGYQMSEIGVYAKDSSDVNAEEKLYFIVIADTVDGVLCADYMPAYNGIAEVSIEQKFQVDIVDADETTITPPVSVTVTQTYLEQYYYNKEQTNALLAKKMNIEVLDSISTLSALNEIATNTDYKNGNYMLLIPVTSGNIIANLDLYIPETAIMTFYGQYVILRFPYNNKTFRYSDSVTYNWARVYADVNPTDSVIAGMINARHPKPQLVYIGTSLANANISRNSTVADQLTNKVVGRRYIIGTDFVEYVDLESTANAEVISQTEPTDTGYIQTWHKAGGDIVQRTQIGDSGTPSAWAEISATTAT
jgi:hypothetical protein